jgi:hypothetical protein
MKIALQAKYSSNPWTVPKLRWKESAPFLLNERAQLIHRPRYVTGHQLTNHQPHLAVWCYCGSGFTGRKELAFIDEPPSNSIVCRRCEEAAVLAGLPSSEELAGRHIHVGGVKAFADCCPGVGGES